jgi:hypothetical protein
LLTNNSVEYSSFGEKPGIAQLSNEILRLFCKLDVHCHLHPGQSHSPSPVVPRSLLFLFVISDDLIFYFTGFIFFTGEI